MNGRLHTDPKRRYKETMTTFRHPDLWASTILA